MGLRPDEISALIKEQIKHFDDIIELKDIGTVMTVGDGVSYHQLLVLKDLQLDLTSHLQLVFP